MGKKRGALKSRVETLQSLYKLRDDLQKLGDMPDGDEAYDYIVEVLKVASNFQDENYTQSFTSSGLTLSVMKNFKKIKRNFEHNLYFFGRSSAINLTRWRQTVSLNRVRLVYDDGNVRIQHSAREWKELKDPNKEVYTAKIKLRMQYKINQFKKSLHDFIRTLE